MTEEIKTCNNNQKMSVYCKTCVCKSCEQIDRLEQENKANLKQIELDVEHICRLNEQIARLEQENENLKKEVKQIGSDFIKKGDYARALEQENKELKEMLSKEPKTMQAFQISYSGLKRDNETLWGMVKDYKSALEEIREICKCSKSPMNCDECPQNDDCEELCVNDENLQDIIYDKITEVLND